jgi:hypothetical protein
LRLFPNCGIRNRVYLEVLDYLDFRCHTPTYFACEAVMPNENATRRSTRLNVEVLENREVPTTFGAGVRGMSIAYGDIIPVQLDGGQAEYITGTGPGRVAEVRVWDNVGTLLNTITPFGDYTGGVFVETGDVNGNGQLDLLVSTAGRTLGRVQVYEFIEGGPQLLVDFTPFGPTYSGPVQIAAGDVTGGLEEEIIAAQGNAGGTVKVFSFDPNVSTAFEIRSFQPYGAAWTRGVTVASDNIHNDFSYDEIITGRGALFPQVKIFNAQQPTVTLMASYMAFDISRPENLRGIDVTAGSTDGIIISNVLFRQGAEIYVSLRGTRVIRAFRGDTGAIITTIRPAQLFPASFATSVNFAVGFSSFATETTARGNLIVVGADGPYNQIPIVFPGAPLSPAGLNGRFPAV